MASTTSDLTVVATPGDQVPYALVGPDGEPVRAKDCVASLTRWIKDGVPAPKAARLQVENGGTPQARVVRDQYGNAMGGYRTPYLDVPVATYVTSTKGEGFCAELGRTDPFSFARLVSAHGTPQNYVAKVTKSVDQLIKDRFLTESDGKKIKAEAGAFSAVTSSN